MFGFHDAVKYDDEVFVTHTLCRYTSHVTPTFRLRETNKAGASDAGEFRRFLALKLDNVDATFQNLGQSCSNITVASATLTISEVEL